MTAFITRCDQCHVEFEPTHDAIVAGAWHTCPACQTKDPPAPTTRCEGCGRVLRAGTRTLCYTCLTGGSGL